jgi:hypothetical protein
MGSAEVFTTEPLRIFADHLGHARAAAFGELCLYEMTLAHNLR